MLSGMLITNSKDLQDFCAHLQNQSAIAVDTEFVREHTYHPVVCLIQVASEEKAACIDPLAEGIDLSPLFKVMQNKKVMKVFHAARQDIEIFYMLTGKVPTPVFDTQIGALACGFDDNSPYHSLVSAYTGVRLDKSSRVTAWDLRPLTAEQESYALSDVTYLIEVYKQMREQLESSGRLAWIQDKMRALEDPDLYNPQPYEMWKKIKCYSSNPKFLAALRELCAWREQLAQTLNRPRKSVLKDEGILEIASLRPNTAEGLSALRAASKSLLKHADEVLEALRRAESYPADFFPPPKKEKVLPAWAKSTAEALRLLLSVVCAQEGVATCLIASADDLEKIALSDTADVPAMQGWRYDLFGQKALAFKRGELLLSFDEKAHRMMFEPRCLK